MAALRSGILYARRKYPLNIREQKDAICVNNLTADGNLSQYKTPTHPHPGLTFTASTPADDSDAGLLTHHICTQKDAKQALPSGQEREWGATLRVWKQGTVAQIQLDTVYKDAEPGFSSYEKRPKRSDLTTLVILDKDTGKRHWKRGKVKPGFSKSARLRMMRVTGKLDGDVLPCYVTLTWSDGNWNSDPKQWKAHLRAFKECLRRHWPDFAAIWRLEFKPRKSGMRIGEVAPHVHLLIWPNVVPQEQRRGWKLTKKHLIAFRDWLDGAWVHGMTQCKAIYNRRGISTYIAKHVAKADDQEIIDAFPDGAGRLWGKWGEDNLPSSDVVELTLTWWEGMAVMRAFKRMANITEDYGFSSLSCFVDTDKFLENLDEIIERELSWMALEIPIE